MRGKVLLAAAVLLLVAGPVAARWGMPEPLTDRGEVIEDIYVKITIAGVITFVLVFVLLVFILARYREGSGKGRATHEKHRGSLAAEMTWTLVPLVVVLWIGYIAYAGLVTLDRGNEDLDPALSIQVTGYQFAWEMDYGGGVKVLINPSIDAATGNVTYSEQFHVPADVPVQFNLTSGDVIHAFNVMDANRGFVSIDDANPAGPHVQHRQIHVLPAGTYFVQCKEMCGPGHAYMRAEIVAEPQADFDRWLEQKSLAAGHDLVQVVPITADADSFEAEGSTKDDNDTASPITIVAGTRVILEVTNDGDQDLNLSLSNTPLGTVPAGETGLLSFDTAEGVPGDRTIVGLPGGNLVFRAIEAEIVDVDLLSYEIQPQNVQLVKDQAYLFRLRGLDSIHNYYIGHWDGQGEKEILGQSPNVSGGGTTAFVYTPTETGTFDTWCDIAGHYEAGMHAHATVR